MTTGSGNAVRSVTAIGLCACAFVLDGFAEDAVRIYFPTNDTVYLQPTNVPLAIQIQVSVTNDFNAAIDIYDGTNFLGSTNLKQHDVLTWSNVAFGEHALVAIHRASAGNATSSVVSIRVDYGGWAIVPPGSVWAYRDGGVDLGTEWRGTNVDVSFWPQGPAKIGFGDDDVVTTVDWQNPSNGEVYPTYYFRRPFIVADPTVCSNVAVRLRRDDGAIVYLNGEELVRDNMPETGVDYRTYASAQVLDENEFVQYWVNRSRLRQGVNYLAVEVHNSNPQSHDIGFDLALVASIPVPAPSLDVRRSVDNALVSWPTGYGGYRLQTATTADPSDLGWGDVTNQLTPLQGRLTHTNRISGTTRFFRLRLD